MGGGASKPAEKERRSSKTKGGGGSGGGERRSTKRKSKDPRVILEQLIDRGDDKEVAKLLGDKPDLVNAALDDDGMRALQVACRSGQFEIVQLLLKLNAFLNQRNESGATALMYAAAGGFDKIVKLILDAGADVRMVDKDKQSALEYAQLNNRTKVENLLQLSANLLLHVHQNVLLVQLVRSVLQLLLQLATNE